MTNRSVKSFALSDEQIKTIYFSSDKDLNNKSIDSSYTWFKDLFDDNEDIQE